VKTDPRLLIRKSLVRAQPGEPIFFRICSSGSFDTCGNGARLVPCRAGTDAGRRPDLSRWPGDLSRWRRRRRRDRFRPLIVRVDERALACRQPVRVPVERRGGLAVAELCRDVGVHRPAGGDVAPALGLQLRGVDERPRRPGRRAAALRRAEAAGAPPLLDDAGPGGERPVYLIVLFGSLRDGQRRFTHPPRRPTRPQPREHEDPDRSARCGDWRRRPAGLAPARARARRPPRGGRRSRPAGARWSRGGGVGAALGPEPREQVGIDLVLTVRRSSLLTVVTRGH